MALAILSPWPTTPASKTAAIACLKAEIDLDDDRVDAIGSVAGALVERYANAAPQAVKNEAVIRCAGWLADSPSSGIRDESAGQLSASYSASMTGALRHSGAMGLLSPWRVRRAGKI